MFLLARELRAIAPPGTKASIFKDALRAFVAIAATSSRTGPWEDDRGKSLAEVFGEFRHCWRSVRYAVGEGPLEKAWARTAEQRIQFVHAEEGDVELIASLAYHLSKEKPVFYLPRQKIAKLWAAESGKRISVMRVSRLIGFLKDELGVIKVVEKYCYTKGKAEEYCFILPPSQYVLRSYRVAP